MCVQAGLYNGWLAPIATLMLSRPCPQRPWPRRPTPSLRWRKWAESSGGADSALPSRWPAREAAQEAGELSVLVSVLLPAAQVHAKE